LRPSDRIGGDGGAADAWNILGRAVNRAASCFDWHSPDSRECAKRVSWISCRDIRHSSYADSRITRFDEVEIAALP
jgi:hypothetical protein